ncbi:MAG: SDR family NAD(P)-dependent oxidoreductase [Pseudomonadota bacterium]
MHSDKIKAHLDNKVIWLTGASSGIGRALTIALSKYNCQIFISSRTITQLEITKNQCAEPNNIHIVEGDLSKLEDNKKICSMIESEFGRLDIAILNAGTCEYVDTDNFDSALFERLISNNYLSMVYGIEASLPLLKKSQHAQLVGMSSTAGYLGLPRSEAYGSSKAAITNMLRALKVTLKVSGVDVSVICPGFVKTELTDKNDFPMPAIISADKAADHIITGIVKGTHEIHFPKPFTVTLKFISLLPDKLQFWLLSKTLEKS